MLRRYVAEFEEGLPSENFRPSVPARLSIDYPRLKAINPHLLYCGLTSYGDSGFPVRVTPKPQ
jgi:crotonobetainyl-CoA:carnitine CoA-transferase CaiB-like acyl-CoA transferase